jgi:hypothetical protein
MSDEKRIARLKIDSELIPGAKGIWVRERDHLDALGEAEKNLRAEEQHRLEVQRACIAANQKLETLRSGLKAEIGRLEISLLCNGGTASDYLDGRTDAAQDVSRRLEQLLDASEDTEKQSGDES